MKKRIIYGTIIVAIAVLFASIILLLTTVYNKNFEQYKLNLKNEAYIVSEAVEKSGISYFDTLKLQDNHRITWIASDGNVLYDSEVDIKTMGNHSSRPEIKQAMKTGYGEDTRYSQTLSNKTLYSAVRLQDGSVLRVSQQQERIFALIISMWKSIIVILLISVVASVILAFYLSRKIVKPINEIDLDSPDSSKVYEEVRPLVSRIAEQNVLLNQKINKLQIDVDEKTREADFRKEFTANVSHELKTPLTSISGFAEIIKNGIVKEDDIAPFAGKIYDEAQRLIVLVGDIIKLSQLDEKQVAARKERIDLYTACEEVFRILESAATDKKVSLNIEGTHIYVEAVDQILNEMIYNLCENAIKYNKEEGKVTATIYSEEGRPAISIADTGIGIPQEDVDRVFERFFRVNKSHSKEIGGTGLGLSIVKHAAAYHNATIKLESALDVGTKITIVF